MPVIVNAPELVSAILPLVLLLVAWKLVTVLALFSVVPVAGCG